MILDTSAVIAIIRDEPERDVFVRAVVAAEHPRISAASYLECGIVVDRLGDPVLSRRFDALLASMAVEVVEVTAQQARIARQAYRDFGRGTGHPAGLNFGDCFPYALAVACDAPLLYKGDDFVHTDVRPALA